MITQEFLDKLREIVGPQALLVSKNDLLVYESDGLTIFRSHPDAVVFPSSTAQVSAIVRLCLEAGVPFMGRGAGTSLSGGSIPPEGGIVLQFSRMKRILETDYENRFVLVEPGTVNLRISSEIGGRDYFYAPDPSSQPVCTIGGNISHNSGGPHCLKYGVTSNHVLGVEVVLPGGEVFEVGSRAADPPGYDLTGVIVGSEGTLGIVTKAVVRILHKPERVRTMLGVFESVADASNSVSNIIASGIVPGAVEMMDNLTIKAVESSVHKSGYPEDAAAVLLVEIDGVKEAVEVESQRVKEVCMKNHAREVRSADDEDTRKKLWAGRKGAFGAMGRLSPTYYVQDGVIPRNKLTQVLRKVEEVSRKYNLPIANVFHAGDGNLHPLILFDGRDPGVVEKVIQAGAEILQTCVEVGGSITGEHGIGLEKKDQMGLIFGEADMMAMRRLKDVFNKSGLLNPNKIFPTRNVCGEATGVKPRVLASA